MWLWYLDRAAGLVAFAALHFAVLTGIVYNARGLDTLRTAARRAHVPVSVFATLVTLAHAMVGTLDALGVLFGSTPVPGYGRGFFVLALAVGAGALLLVVVAVVAFLDAKRIERPWTPRAVHLFAYGGFAFATVHTVAIGTDITGLAVPALVAATALVVYALALRAFTGGSRSPLTEGGGEARTPPADGPRRGRSNSHGAIRTVGGPGRGH